jgi:hypothetical protein
MCERFPFNGVDPIAEIGTRIMTDMCDHPFLSPPHDSARRHITVTVSKDNGAMTTTTHRWSNGPSHAVAVTL